MKKVLKWLAVGSMTGLLAACASGPKIKSDYDHAANFSQFQTFAFMTPLGTERLSYDTFLNERLKSAARAQMEMRGYTYSTVNPDLLINFGARIHRTLQVTPMAPIAPYYAYRAGFYGGWSGYAWGGDVQQYTDGTLNIDLVDARRWQLAWEGVAEGQIQHPDSIDSPQKVDKLVAEIFAKYPFQAGVDRPQLPNQGKQ